MRPRKVAKNPSRWHCRWCRRYYTFAELGGSRRDGLSCPCCKAFVDAPKPDAAPALLARRAR